MFSLNSLPLGYRFRPTDGELVDYYLRKKINGDEEQVKVIREIDVCRVEPWDLPHLSVIKSNDLEWFFFCPRDRKYPNGRRSNRATVRGYWKATGKDRIVKKRLCPIGTKKTLVFYTGRAPHGKRSNWVMHEYSTTLKELDGTHPGQSAFVLCRLFKKQDERVDDSHCNDEVELADSSPVTTKSSPEESDSELAPPVVTPDSGRQAEEQPSNFENCQLEDFGTTTPDSLVLAERDTYSNIANDRDYQLAEVTGFEDPLLNENMNSLFNPIFDQEVNKIFSPPHLHAEFGFSLPHYSPDSNFSDKFAEFPALYDLQSGNNDQDDYISDFLHSVINYSDCEEPDSSMNSAVESGIPEYSSLKSNHSVVNGSSFRELEPEVAQPQLEPGHLNFIGMMEPIPTGHINFVGQNTFDPPQTLQWESHALPKPEHCGSEHFGSERFGSNNLSMAYGTGYSTGPGITIRHQAHNQPRSHCIDTQGTASRRIRLLSSKNRETEALHSCKVAKIYSDTKDDGAKSTVCEEGKILHSKREVVQGEEIVYWESGVSEQAQKEFVDEPFCGAACLDEEQEGKMLHSKQKVAYQQGGEITYSGVAQGKMPQAAQFVLQAGRTLSCKGVMLNIGKSQGTQNEFVERRRNQKTLQAVQDTSHHTFCDFKKNLKLKSKSSALDVQKGRNGKTIPSYQSIWSSASILKLVVLIGGLSLVFIGICRLINF